MSGIALRVPPDAMLYLIVVRTVPWLNEQRAETSFDITSLRGAGGRVGTEEGCLLVVIFFVHNLRCKCRRRSPLS